MIDPTEKETPDNGVDQDVLEEKIADTETPGFEAEFDPDEADELGAFEEDALSEEDAKDSCIDGEMT